MIAYSSDLLKVKRRSQCPAKVTEVPLIAISSLFKVRCIYLDIYLNVF